MCLLGLTEHPRSYRTLPTTSPASRLSGTGPRALYIFAYLYTYFYHFRLCIGDPSLPPQVRILVVCIKQGPLQQTT
jgi:hypothetical protein